MIGTYGEIMLRISPFDSGKRLIQANNFRVEPGGSESNVAIALSLLGNQVAFITKLPDNVLGRKILRYLESYKVETSFIVLGGERVGLYWVENGVGPRPYSVVYDRNNSAFSQMDFDELNQSVFKSKFDWFHMSGITPAISKKSFETAMNLLGALSPETKVSIDLNFRSKLWNWLEEKNPEVLWGKMKSFCKRAFLITGNETDFQNALGYGAEEDDKEKLYNQIAEQAFGEFDMARFIAISLRGTLSASENIWSGRLYCKSQGKVQGFSSFSFKIDAIVDRVGTGDCFTAGIIHGLLHFGEDFQHVINFAVAASALNHTVKGDAFQFSEEEVEHAIKTFGSGQIIR
jgi:2-dehydro-3-deoxygluconokinase